VAHRRDRFQQWLTRAEEHVGTWWEDWMAWLKPQAGPLVDAYPVVTQKYPRLADAPGTYVLES
jgi:polyhydroxyalkanoate synthase